MNVTMVTYTRTLYSKSYNISLSSCGNNKMVKKSVKNNNAS